jgi:branched-chain amino acid transport system ATP-binding protein
VSALLETKDLGLAHGKLEVVRAVSLRVDPGELVVVLGANGAGKSTLVSAVIGWLIPRNGQILFKGEDITRLAPWQRSRLGIGSVPERGRLFGDLTVSENFEIARPSRKGLDFALDLFPVLRDRRNQLARTLSGGQRQMLALGRALSTEPKLLVVDEMSTGLMPVLVSQLFGVLRRLADNGLPVLLVEQNTKVLSIADRAYVMQTGIVVKEGDAQTLARDPEIKSAYLGL